MKKEKPIDYGYLNLDNKKFVESKSKLISEIGPGGFIRCILKPDHNQILYAASYKTFSDSYAILISRKINKI